MHQQDPRLCTKKNYNSCCLTLSLDFVLFVLPCAVVVLGARTSNQEAKTTPAYTQKHGMSGPCPLREQNNILGHTGGPTQECFTRKRTNAKQPHFIRAYWGVICWSPRLDSYR